MTDIRVPDIGSESADVIEILVKVGDTIAVDQPMVVLESDKASMEVPCPQGGIVREIAVKIGDGVKPGDLLLQLDAAALVNAAMTNAAAADVPVREIQQELEQVSVVLTPGSAMPPPPISVSEATAPEVSAPVGAASAAITFYSPTPSMPVPTHQQTMPSAQVHAGPAVRRLARELGVDLGKVTGTGPKERILKDDVHAFVKKALTEKTVPVASSTGLPALPIIDFSKWGVIERLPLTKIQRVSAQNLHRAWVTIPHVTQFDEADITELEAFRVAQKEALKAEGLSLTILAFLVKAAAHVLKQFPKFNSSLDGDGEHLVYKKYVHIGVAVDTPNGLVVPVIRDADQKSVRDITRDLGELSAKAREKKLMPADMQGGCFSISSLGGIGGTAFTPIVNWPEVAILGVSRSAMKPVWNGQEFQPRLMLPLSLSYDHRVIDGADAARFTTALSKVLADIRQLLL